MAVEMMLRKSIDAFYVATGYKPGVVRCAPDVRDALLEEYQLHRKYFDGDVAISGVMVVEDRRCAPGVVYCEGVR